MVSTHLKNISQIGNLPQIGVKKKIFETTTQNTVDVYKYTKYDYSFSNQPVSVENE